LTFHCKLFINVAGNVDCCAIIPIASGIGSWENTELRAGMITSCYLRIRLSGLAFSACLLLLFLFAAGTAWPAASSEVSPVNPAEYMIYQYSGVALLIRIDAFETEFESRIYGPDRALIKSSRIPSRRVGPVYQFIEAVDADRQLIIEVTPAYPTDRSRIGMELVQMRESDKTSANQAEAFRLMSRAADSTTASDSTTWAMKTYTFSRAAAAFEQLGWQELQLWCEYFVAHLVFYQLHDEHSAIELARSVQAAARKAGFGVIEMTALQLEGAALLAESPIGPAMPTQRKLGEAHRVLSQAAELADELGYQSERALALFSDGVAWEKQEELSRALEQYRRALDIAVAASDTELANRIRNSAAFAYESQGRISGAIDMLDQIGDELSEEEATLELAQSLYKKGTILINNYRYPEAVAALSEAVSLQQSAGSLDRAALSGFALGQAYYGMGQMEQAVRALLEPIERTPASGNEAALENALGVLAAAYRFRGNFGAMTDARKEQAAFVSSDARRARLPFEQAMDLLAQPGSGVSSARSLLLQSRQLAIKAGIPLLGHRALLQLCVHTPGNATVKQLCSKDAMRGSFDQLLVAGIPRYALEARHAWSVILHRQGRPSQAIEQMSRLAEDIRFFRQVLPGVLGAWYWENRDRIFSDYMSMILQQSTADSGSLSDGRQALFVFERLRAIVSDDSRGLPRAVHSGSGQQTERVRSMLVERESASDEAAALRQAEKVNSALKSSRQEFEISTPALTMDKLQGLLGRLAEQTALLSYYFSDDKVHAFVARRRGVQLLELPRSGDIRFELGELRKNPGIQAGQTDDQLDRLGRLIAGPVADLLPEFVYLLPSGPLNGFPFDLLRLDGHYLAERHKLLQLTSLTALGRQSRRLETGQIDLFFLAGDPQVKKDVFSYEQEISAEIRAVTDIFVGPALHIVQGSAMQRDEFEDERFERADVVHMAIPGVISLESPAQSKLVLSGTLDKPGVEYLSPRDFQDRQFNASLAVLSATRVQGSGTSSFNSYLGFVSDLMQSGIAVVVVSLWAIEDAERARFMAAFYRNLATNPDVAMALLKTRQQVFSGMNSENTGLWGGFQVYIN
jgi:CHAT domain-containing protein/tetratricopeptide (TPR) repeat protein